ncbi:MAG: hypothetical protein N3H30_02395 [Candidatus Micrarchaeota archaeon]|nr:hypothetical protein [Candidatus Micrarchaeota archaeon]
MNKMKVGLAVVAAAVAFNTATAYAQENSDASIKKKIAEITEDSIKAAKEAMEARKKEAEARQKEAQLRKEAEEARQKEAEARQKEAEARQSVIANCKRMKEILDKKENECKTRGCDENTRARIAKAWITYNDQCKEFVVDITGKSK